MYLFIQVNVPYFKVALILRRHAAYIHKLSDVT